MYFTSYTTPAFRTANTDTSTDDEDESWKYVAGRSVAQISLIDPKDVFGEENAARPMIASFKKYLKDNCKFGEIALSMQEDDLKSLYRSNGSAYHHTEDIRELYSDANGFFGGLIATADVFRLQPNGVPIFNNRIDETIMRLMCKFSLRCKTCHSCTF